MGSASAFQPFRVELTLQGMMVVPDAPIHLDALLARARVDQDAFAGVQVIPPWANQHDLPLARLETSAGWCFKASWLSIEYDSPPVQYHQPRKADVDQWRAAYEQGLFKRMPSFDPARTHTKAASVLLPMRIGKRAVGYGVGDVKKVRELLLLIPSLGKLKRRGAGRVASVSVEVCDEHECNWMRRHLPIDAPFANAGEYTEAAGTLRAPYWQRENATRIAVPIS